jgi:hypothetical protein
VDYSGLSDAEQLLIKAFPDGSWLDLRSNAGPDDDGVNWGAERIIRAEVIASLLLGAVTPKRGKIAAIRLRGAKVTGRLDLMGATVAYALVCEQCYFDDPPRFVEATVKTIWISDSRLPGMDAARMRVDGVLDLHGSSLGGPLVLGRASISAEVNLSAVVIDSGANGAAIAAEGLSTDGNLDCGKVEARGQRGTPVLVVDGSVIGTEIDLIRACIQGEVEARAIRVGGRVHLQHAMLDNGSGTALRLTRSAITGDVLCDDTTVIGKIRMVGTTLGGSLFLRKSRLQNPGKYALDAPQLEAKELYLMPADVQGIVGLNNARIGVLLDDPLRWPAELEIDGLTYDALNPQLTARERLDWLARDIRVRQPQKYEQLAAYFARIGQPADARRVMYAKECHQRPAKGRLSRAWGILQDITVGYGYRPWRAVLWFAALLAIGSAVYAVSPPPALTPAAAPHFNPVGYTLDLLLPVVNLGQKYAFNPGGLEQWLSYLLVAAGWVLATTITAGIARVLTRR